MTSFMRRNYRITYLLIGIIFLTSITLTLTFTGEDDEGYLVLSGERLAVRLNPQSNSFYIDNILDLKLFPSISVSGNDMPVPEPRFSNPAIGAKMDTFSVEYPDGFIDDVYADVKVEVTNQKVIQTITLENTKDSEVLIQLSLTDSNDLFEVYAPFTKEQSRNYFYMSPRDYGMFGRMLVIYFDPYPPSYPIPIERISVQSSTLLVWAIKIPSKSKYTLKLEYLSSYLADSNAIANFPVKSTVDKEPFLIVETDPLLTFYHKEDFEKLVPELDLSKSGMDILKDITEYVNSLEGGDPEFGLTSYVDWSVISTKTEYNSLEKAVIFREICRKVGIPARLVLGKKRGGNYYAWVIAYVGGLEQIYDPFNQRTEYPMVYEEPEPYLCKDDVALCRLESVVRVGVLCIGPFCVNLILVGGIILLLILALFGIVFYKSDVLAKLLSEKPLTKLKIEGSYDIAKPEFRTKDPMLQEVFEYVKSKAGLVDIDDMAHTLGYSRILITSAIEKLIEEGVLVRR